MAYRPLWIGILHREARWQYATCSFWRLYRSDIIIENFVRHYPSILHLDCFHNERPVLSLRAHFPDRPCVLLAVQLVVYLRSRDNQLQVPKYCRIYVPNGRLWNTHLFHDFLNESLESLGLLAHNFHNFDRFLFDCFLFYPRVTQISGSIREQGQTNEGSKNLQTNRRD